MYACFFDYQKAFDEVKHDKLIGILNIVEVDKRDLRIINNLYWNQAATCMMENSRGCLN